MARDDRWNIAPSPQGVARHRASGAWRNRTLADDARDAAASRPDEVLWVEGDNRLTAGAAYEQARNLAANLHRMGLREGDVVSFQLPNWTETVVLDIACVLLGLVVNPIVPIYRDAELQLILADCGAKALFVPEEFRSVRHAEMVERMRSRLPELRHVVVVRGEPTAQASRYEDLLAPADLDAVPWPRQKPEAIKMIMYTSGTTGRPKGVLHTHETMARAMEACFNHWGLETGDWTLMPSPVTHVTGFSYGIEWPLVVGTRTVFMERWNAAGAVSLIDSYGVAVTVGATPFLAELVDAAEKAGSSLPSLKVFGCGGAAVPPALIRRANASFANSCAFRIYGATEAPVVTLGYLGRAAADEAADTDGEIVGYDVRVVDDAGRDVAPGEDGELLVRGPSLFLGYLDPADREGSLDADGYFRTGDIGRIVNGNGILVTGRKKDLIIRGGENLSAKEIEDALHRHELIREAAVVAMPHARLGETVCAYLIATGAERPDVAALAGFLDAAGLARQKYPERVEYVDDFPRTASGKVRKDLLRKRIAEALTSESA